MTTEEALEAYLDEHGHHADAEHGFRAVWTAALFTPPADDVREALAECIHAGLRRDDWGVANEDEREEPLAAADAILADPRFDIRAHRQSTPPVDDVREALYTQIAADLIDRIGWQRISADLVRGIVREWELHTAAEVHPRGTVTDAEVEAALAVLRSETPGKRSQFDCVRAALEAAGDARS